MTAVTDEKIINKIKGLFAIANDTRGNTHQAEAAMVKAYELLARHGLSKTDVEKSAAATESFVKDKGMMYGKRMPTEWPYISGILTEFFNINTMRVSNPRNRNENYVWFIGKETDVEIAKVVYNQLYYQYKQLWEQYREKNNAPTTEKRSYYQGLLTGLYRRLKAAKTNIEQEMGLVIIKDPKLDEFVKTEFNNIKTIAIAKYTGSSEIRQAGVNDSKNIQINQAIKAGDNNSMKLLN